jgi:hypothetical protein
MPLMDGWRHRQRGAVRAQGLGQAWPLIAALLEEVGLNTLAQVGRCEKMWC